MNKKFFKYQYFLLPIIFLFNYLVSIFVSFLTKLTPYAYQINTGSLSKLFNEIKSNFFSYLISFLGYLLIYFIFIILIISTVLAINNNLSIKKIKLNIKKISVYFVTLLLLLLLYPLNQIGLKIPITNYLTVPESFISMVSGPIMVTSFIIIYVILFLLLVRFRFTLSYLINENFKLNKALNKSWQATKKTTPTILKNIFLTIIGIFIVGFVFYLSQYLVDKINNRTLSILFVNIFTCILVGILYAITTRIVILFTTQNDTKPTNVNKIIYFILAIFVGFLSVSLSGKLLQKTDQNYLVIAHMAVSKKSDVPNSILSIKKATKTNPDYLEIDIQPTKDYQYVLSHDGSIESTSGKKYKIVDYTWRELKDVKFKSNNKVVTLTNFTNYIKEANRLNQKLLIELKINSTISDEKLKAFTTTYRELLKANNAQIQSLNQNLIRRLNKYVGNDLGLISPIKSAINATKTNTFYSIEYSSLNKNQIVDAAKYHKSIYAWTVDKKPDISTVYAYGVQGFITDYPKTTRNYLQKIKSKPDYKNIFWNTILFKRENF